MNKLTEILPLLERLAPTLAAVLGTPLLGGAVAGLEAVFGITPAAGATVDDRANIIAQAIEGASPETLAAIHKADQDYAAKMADLGFKDKEALAQLSYQTQKLAVDDVTNAREIAKNNATVYNLALCILVTFGIVMGGVLWGSYALLTGGLPLKEVPVVAAVSGLVGSVVGYAAANAQTVINFLYGGSIGSSRNIDAMTTAIKKIGGAS